MDVRVVTATAPLGEDVRGALQAVTTQATSWDASVADASTFDSPSGVGFDSHPVAAGIVPPPGTITGSGSALALDPVLAAGENFPFVADEKVTARRPRTGRGG